jgi:hypothetical protein
MRKPEKRSLEERLDLKEISRNIVNSSNFSKEEVKEMVIQQKGKTLGESEQVLDDVMLDYYYNLNEGFPDEKETVEFSIDSACRDTRARPVEDWDERGENQKAKRLAKEEADTSVEDITEDIFVDDEEQLVKNARAEYETVEETVEETNWDAVQAEIEENLRRKIINDKEAHERVRNVLDKFGGYDYSETELWRFTDEVINEVAERWSNVFVSQILQSMESSDFRQEKHNVERTVEKSLKETVTEGVVGGVTEKLTSVGIREFAGILAVVALGL